MAQEPVLESAPRPQAKAESRRDRAGRYARRTNMHANVAVAIAVLVLLVILIAENTRRVEVGWVFGYGRVSLVFLVLFAAVLGWLLGMATAILVRRSTRAPR